MVVSRQLVVLASSVALVANLAGVVDSFSVARPSSSFSSFLSSSCSSSNRPQTRVTPLFAHDFWGRERTHAEVEQHVLSCLDAVGANDNDDDDDASTMTLSSAVPRVEVVSAEPPLVVMHDFLSSGQCQAIIDAAEKTNHLERSTTGATQETSASRTSSTVWLRDDQCPSPLRKVADQVSRISGLPPSYMENLQVVRYQPGQQFQLHTDHQNSFNDLECRGRLATCLIYLAEPLAGGATWFPGVHEQRGANAEVTIAPRRGSAVFFWNTVERPGSTMYTPEMFLHADLQLRHAGLPVLEGEKWICNRWIHPVDFGAGVRGKSSSSSSSIQTPTEQQRQQALV